jgi:hypothetical protein
LKIIRHNLKDKFDQETLYLFIIAFAVYPLFLHTVSWGIARKHLMAFFFALVAISSHTQENEQHRRFFFKSSFYYFLSILSQPITILMPFWFIISDFFHGRKIYDSIKKNALSLFVFFVMTIVNFSYYDHSKSFSFIYNSKTEESFNFADKLLAIGHYHLQIFFPYKFSFFYDLGDFRVIIGLVLLSFLLLIFYFRRLPFKDFFYWPSFGYLTLIVVLNTPQMLYDTYLLIFGFSFFLVLIEQIPQRLEIKLKFIMIFLISFWSLFSWNETFFWINRINFAKMSFNRTPHCRSAINLLNISYIEGIMPEKDLKDFISIHECVLDKKQTQGIHAMRINLIAHVLFYEDHYPLNERINGLKGLAKNNMEPHLVLAALYLKNNDELEAKKAINQIISSSAIFEKPDERYHFITANYILPYCQKIMWKECLEIAQPLSVKKINPYF